MATLKAIVRKQRADGFYPRYVHMRKDSGGGSIEIHEMRIDIAVVTEGVRDRQAGGKGNAGAVYKDIDLLVVVFGKFLVNSSTVEAIAPDVSFQRDIVSGLRHGKSILYHEVTAIIMWLKRHAKSWKMRNFAV